MVTRSRFLTDSALLLAACSSTDLEGQPPDAQHDAADAKAELVDPPAPLGRLETLPVGHAGPGLVAKSDHPRCHGLRFGGVPYLTSRTGSCNHGPLR